MFKILHIKSYANRNNKNFYINIKIISYMTSVCIQTLKTPGRFLAPRRLFLRKPFLILGGPGPIGPPAPDQIHGWRGLFSLFYFFLDALIWACVNPMLHPGPPEPVLFKGGPSPSHSVPVEASVL